MEGGLPGNRRSRFPPLRHVFISCPHQRRGLANRITKPKGSVTPKYAVAPVGMEDTPQGTAHKARSAPSFSPAPHPPLSGQCGQATMSLGTFWNPLPHSETQEAAPQAARSPDPSSRSPSSSPSVLSLSSLPVSSEPPLSPSLLSSRPRQEKHRPGQSHNRGRRRGAAGMVGGGRTEGDSSCWQGGEVGLVRTVGKDNPFALLTSVLLTLNTRQGICTTLNNKGYFKRL